MTEAPMDPVAVPKELAERDQWLLWDNSADTPRRPHWKGDFGISWSDPDDWHSFEDTVEAARERESWGIGYVTAATNDDHPRGLYGCLDLDGAVYYSEEKGGVKPEDWLPSLQEFIEDGGYIEVSPSGEGLHVWTVGHEPPEWWSDSHFSADEHRGVEFLTNKFVTVTGDTLADDYDSVAETDPTDFLFRAYTEINGENPRLDDADGAASSGGQHRELTEDEVAGALDHVDSNCGYSEWRNIGFAVHDWDDGPTGKRVFEQWSRGSGWDDDSQDYIEKIWSGAEQGNGITIGTLIHHAKEGGWTPPHTSESPSFPDSHDRRDDAESDESDGTDDAPEVPTRSNYEWDSARAYYEDEDTADGLGRLAAADTLEDMTSWMHVQESDILWVYDDSTGYFEPRGEAYAKHVLERELGAHFSIHDCNEILARLEARNQTRRKELNARTRATPLLCVGNGVVDLETGDLLDHSPAYKFTRGLPWDYTPEDADTEPILDFLDDITTREADRDTLLDHLAHGLMPGHPYRAFVMTYGPGSNGKTQLGKLFRGFVGEDNTASVELQDLTGDDEFATGSLPGSFINIGDDISVGQINDVSTLKSLSGDGTMRANEKFEKKYDFKNEAAMFFSANEPPRIMEKTDAVADRLYPIEMPYRFVDDPDGEREKPKTPNVAGDLLDDDAVMRGLLALAVEHAQRLTSTGGQYSQPEGPQERLEMYEAASDPIKRFALDHLDATTSSNDVIAKADAYTVYTHYCDAQGERSATEDVFKRKVGELASIDLESRRSRAVTAGEDRDPVWAYVAFAESARQWMPNRLEARYFEDDGVSMDDDPDGGDESDTDAPYGATPIMDAARSATGYQTVTAEIADVQTLGGEGNTTTKATLVDESGAIDLVTWSDTFAASLSKYEGQTVAVRNAELGSHDGTTQLQANENVTELVEIQAGVGHTTGDRPDDQYGLDDTADESDDTEAVADGGTEDTDTEDDDTADETDASDEYAQPKPVVMQAVREAVEANGNQPATAEDVAAQCRFDLKQVRSTLHSLKTNTQRLQKMNGGYIPT